MMNKKGVGLEDLYPAVMAILIIGIALGIGIFVLTETSDAISTSSITIENETITGFAVAGDALARQSHCGAHDFGTAVVTNATEQGTGSQIIPANNYTLTTDGYLYAKTGSQYIGTDVNITYSYTGTSDQATTSECKVLTTTSTGVGGMADWIAIIVVVLAAAVVIGIVFTSFAKDNAV